MKVDLFLGEVGVSYSESKWIEVNLEIKFQDNYKIVKKKRLCIK